MVQCVGFLKPTALGILIASNYLADHKAGHHGNPFTPPVLQKVQSIENAQILQVLHYKPDFEPDRQRGGRGREPSGSYDGELGEGPTRASARVNTRVSYVEEFDSELDSDPEVPKAKGPQPVALQLPGQMVEGEVDDEVERILNHRYCGRSNLPLNTAQTTRKGV